MNTSEVRKNTAPVSPPALTPALLLLLPLCALFFSSRLRAAQFEACSQKQPTSIPASNLSCQRTDEIDVLRTTGLAVSSRLDATRQMLKDAVSFQDELERTVLTQLEGSLTTYSRRAACDSKCADEFRPMIAKLEPEISKLRLEMSLMQPEEVGTNAIETTRGWMSVQPRHPFAKSPAVPALSAREQDLARDEFLSRLAERLPFVAARLPKIKARTAVLGETTAERTQVAQAVIQIQNEARKNYLRAIGGNPLLIFLAQSHPELPPSSQDLAAASEQLAKEIAAEITRLRALPPSIEKSHAFIEYKPLVESMLRRHPEFCANATNVANDSESRRTTQRVGLVIGQVAAGFASAALCSTIVSCGLAAAVLSAADFGIAAHDAKTAFRQGLGSVVTAETQHDASDLMANADSAARLQGLTLVLGAPTVLKSGGEVLRASNSLFRNSARATEAVTSKAAAPSKELAGLGHARRQVSSPFANVVYASLFKDRSVREKEIIEELIRRYEAKGLDPLEISTTLKQRVNQCAR